MPDRPKQPMAPDLFAPQVTPPHASRPITSNVKIAPATHPSPPRYLLPKDLPGALAQLSDNEIDSLLAALIEEAKGRGRLPSDMRTKPAKTDRAAQRRHEGRTGDRMVALTPGQTNAVRAAFKAGVKPAAMAREFRISPAAVRLVLAADTRGRKS